jgi:hypothetical protein
MRWSCLVSLGLLSFTAACSSANFSSIPIPTDPDDPTTPTPVGGCAAKKLPTEDPCAISDDVGVFVSRSLGSQSGDGSRQRPFASLAAGVAEARRLGKRVYACAETYDETLTFADGVSVFGYFECAGGSWTVGSRRATVQAPTSPAARARDIKSTTRVEALEIVAPDATLPSQSSIGVLAVDAPGLVFVRSRLHGGVAGHGAPGVDGTQLTNGSSIDGQEGIGFDRCSVNLQFCNLLFSTPRSGGTNVCVGKPGISGGPGGDGGLGGRYYVDTSLYPIWIQSSVPPVTNGAGGNANTAAGGTAQSGPMSGAHGAPGSSGQPGGEVGALDEEVGYVPADGTAGSDGSPGQGGGGGAGILPPPNQLPPANNNVGFYFYGRLGGGGGAGGCPGLAGTPGRGGGASLGLVAIRSELSLESSTVESGPGGNGGAAGAPSTPTLGGRGGAPVSGGWPGAPGGNGGPAGASGNGGGGPSAAIAYDKAHPVRIGPNVSLVTGAAGSGVAERNVAGVLIPASPSGARFDVLPF